MQLRRLAALERQKIIDEYDELQAKIADYNDILSNEPRQRSIVSDELAEITAKYADERRSIIIPWDGEVTDEDLIAEEDVVVTITRGGYAKRTLTNLYRAQRRGGKGVRGAALRGDDVVEHFFVTTTHHYLLFFTNKGRVYRAKAYELPDSGRDARGQHVANLLAFQPEEKIAQVLDVRDYGAASFLVLATRDGMVKKTRLEEFDSNRSGGVIAINLKDDDELISAQLVDEDADLLLVSAKGMSVRFTADDETLRPMGRATSGVIGMRFRAGDELLAMDTVRPDAYVVTVTDGGYAKRTPVVGVDAEGPRHLRRARDEARRGARLARRCPRRRRGRRALRDRLRRRRHPHPGGRHPGHRSRHDGRLAHGRERRQRDRVGRARRGHGRLRRRPRRRDAEGTEDRPRPDGDASSAVGLR